MAVTQDAATSGANFHPVSKEIVYGGDENFPPYEYLDKKGVPAGFNIDLIRAVARNRGLTVKITLLPWKQVNQGLQTGRIDVASMYRSSKRAQIVDFAVPHELIYHEMFVKTGSPALFSLADLMKKRVLVESGTLSDDVLTEIGLGTNIIRSASEPEALRLLAAGEGDVALVTQAVGRPFQQREGLSGITVTGPPVLLSEYAFATRKGRRMLIETLNEGIMLVRSSGEYDKLYTRWLRPDRSARMVVEIAWVLGGTLVITLLVIGWNRILHRLVSRQTQSLRESEERLSLLNAGLEQRVSERTAQLEAANKELESFSYSVSHDLRSPLRGIDGWAYALKENYAAYLGQEGGEMVDRVRGNVQRMTNLIDDLLRLARLSRQPLTLQTVCVADVVRWAWRDQGPREPSLTPPVEFVQGALPDCQADDTLLTQIFVNLLSNAVKFSCGQPHPRIEVGSQMGVDGRCTYFVRDNGVGFDPRLANKLFIPFQRLHSASDFPGTGIGLAIVHRIIQRLGGRIWAEGAVGQGATFYFTLALPAEGKPRDN